MRPRIELDTDEIIDSHTHCGGFLLSNLLLESYPYSQDTLDLVRKMQSNKVKYSICFPFPIAHGFCESFTPELYNRLLAKEVKTFGKGFLLPFAYIRLDDTLQRQFGCLEQLFNDLPFYGVKLYPNCDKYSICDNEIEEQLTTFLLSYDCPVIVHSSFEGFGNPRIILDFARKHPNIRVTLAHAARFLKSAFSEIKNLQNVFLDCSPLNMLCEVMRNAAKKNRYEIEDFSFDKPEKVLYQLTAIFPDRLLWGSDSPCSFLTNFSDNALVEFSEKYTYEADIKVLRSLPFNYINQIANKNTLRFLFG